MAADELERRLIERACERTGGDVPPALHDRRSAYRRLLDSLGLRRVRPQRAQHPERDLSGH